MARLLFLQVLAVIGIAAAITVLAALVGPDHDDDVRAIAPSRSDTATPSTTGDPSSASKSAPATTGESATPSVSTSPATTPPGVPEVVKVDVLNQSAENGSAGRLARRLRDAGWPIGRVEDFHGNVRTTTVYWLDPDQRRQARQISRFMGGARVQQGFGTLVDGRVTVILVD